MSRRNSAAAPQAMSTARRTVIRSFLALAIAVPGLVGVAALPAQAVATGQVDTVRSVTVAAVDVETSGDGNYMHDADAAWVRPVPGKVTSPFGPRGVICNPAGCSTTIHEGIDLGSGCGTPIKAVSPGRVTFSGDGGAFGQRVIVDHGSGVASVYGHAQVGSLKVAVGQQVRAGTIIANVGATGVATGCHLDLKIRVGGVYVDPAPWMAFRGIKL